MNLLDEDWFANIFSDTATSVVFMELAVGGISELAKENTLSIPVSAFLSLDDIRPAEMEPIGKENSGAENDLDTGFHLLEIGLDSSGLWGSLVCASVDSDDITGFVNVGPKRDPMLPLILPRPKESPNKEVEEIGAFESPKAEAWEFPKRAETPSNEIAPIDEVGPIGIPD